MRVARLALAALPLLSAACATELAGPDTAPPSAAPALGPPPAGNNAPPTLSITSPADGAVVPLGSPITISADFTDPDPSDLHTCTIDWEVTLTAGTVTESNGTGSCAGSYSLGSEGTYGITMSLIDSFGNTATESITVTVQDQTTPEPEPEPMVGLVIGEGKLQAAARRLSRHLAREGARSNFRRPGPTRKGVAPAAGSLPRAAAHEPRAWFDARRFDDVTVTPGHAVISGIGSLKGRGAYRFTLWLTDGDRPGGDGIDRARLRIWTDREVSSTPSPASTPRRTPARPRPGPHRVAGSGTLVPVRPRRESRGGARACRHLPAAALHRARARTSFSRHRGGRRAGVTRIDDP
ncbi:MAG: hypothetical protein R2909_21515 [Gemmatimonadales bacterium]